MNTYLQIAAWVISGNCIYYVKEYICLFSTERFGLTDPSYYYYLNQSGTYSVDGLNDVKEYEETRVRLQLL